MTELIKQGVSRLSAIYPEREAREIVFAFLESLAGIKRHTHILEPSYIIDDKHTAQAMAAFERMAGGEPLQYVMGKAYFYGREFVVSPSVLIPRPETELLCREAISFLKERQKNQSHRLRVLDLCTGSGCIAWTLALECPGVEVVAVDLSADALDIAISQPLAADSVCPPRFIKTDVLAGPDNNMGTFDLIVSNPPYVMESEKKLMRANVLDHEPHLALFVSDNDPLVFYRYIAEWAVYLLDKNGLGIVEINEALGHQTEHIFINAGISDTLILKDMAEKDRFVRFAY